MAKGYGLTGKIRGKLGSKVYRVEAGQQIISEYEPTKRDAKTQSQLIQRSKMSIATQVSKVFPWETIVGYSYNRSVARRDFVSSLTKIATPVVSDMRIDSTISMENIKLSKGVPVRYNNKSFVVITTQEYTSINGNIAWGLETAAERFLLVVCVVDIANQQPRLATWSLSTARNESGLCQGHMNLATTVQLSGVKFYGYAVPIVPNTLKKRVVYENIVVDTELGEIAAQALESYARAGLFESTIFLGEYTLN